MIGMSPDRIGWPTLPLPSCVAIGAESILPRSGCWVLTKGDVHVLDRPQPVRVSGNGGNLWGCVVPGVCRRVNP